MIRVLQIGMHDKIGGVETYLMNYYRNVNKNIVQFDFISTFERLCFEDEINQLGGRIYKLPSEKKHPIKYFNMLKNIIKDNKYEIVHINMLSAANILPVIASKIVNVKHIIVHSHNSNTPSGFIRKFLNFINRPLLKLATEYWACSKMAGNWLFGNKSKIKIIYNAVDYDKFKYSETYKKEIQNKYNIQNKYVLGHVGRFSYQKNHEFLLEFFYEYQKVEKNSILMLIGSGELENSVKNKVKFYGIENKVLFVGNVKDVEKYMSAMDIFVLPSRFEGLPVTGIEAQVNGLPCLFSTNISREVAISSNAFFIDNNVEEWVKATNKYLKKSNCSIRNTCCLEEYNIRYASEKVTEYYIKMCSKRRRLG